MKHKPIRFLWLASSIIGFFALLLLLNILANQNHTAYAHNTQERTLQAGIPPREILVNNQCSKYNDENSGTDPEEKDVQKDRFGDEKSHYFKFWGKSGNYYKITTNIFNGPIDNPVIGVDTLLLLYRNNPLENSGELPVDQNDDKFPITVSESEPANDPFESEIIYLATEDSYYWVEVQNRIESGNGTYCLGVELISNIPNETITTTSPDACEDNNSIATACEIDLQRISYGNPGSTTKTEGNPTPFPTPFPGPTKTLNTLIFNFKPIVGLEPNLTYYSDLDYYKVWVKEGETYTCETENLSQVNDTQIILFNKDGAELGRNDDMVPSNGNVSSSNRASKITSLIDYDGWLYILVEPVVEVDFGLAHLYTYQLKCTGTIVPISPAAPTPTVPAGRGAAPILEVADSAPIDVVNENSEEAVVASISDAPNVPVGVTFVVLPARTPTPLPTQAVQASIFTVQIYYDQNDNHLKDENEGVADIPVYFYTGLSDEPIQATTTAGGAVFVSTETANGFMQLVVPYLNINQEISVTDIQDLRLRIASR